MKKITRVFNLDHYGWIATSSLMVCLISGIILAIGYDIASPFLSLTILITSNPYGSFFRNLHYWSAQLFLVFLIIHVYHHLKKSSENKIASRNIWFGLVLSLVFTGYVMISGFILKADADSLQARRIISTLLELVPFIGKSLQRIFIGNEGSFQLIYVHHIATATIIILIAVYEHVRSIKIKTKTLLMVLLMTSLFAVIFQAPVYTMDERFVKGPWYFVGLQEALHFLNHPGYLVFFLLVTFTLIFFIPVIKEPIRKIAKKFLWGIIFIYFLISMIGYFFRGENWNWQWPWDSGYTLKTAFRLKPVSFNEKVLPLVIIQGRAEGCMSCHSGMKGLSASHNSKQTGCYLCHRGDPFTLNKDQAHRKMELIPGNLSNSEKTCGSPGCHTTIQYRVSHSLMANASGIISVDREVFGDSKTNSGASDQHLSNLCLGCHLTNDKLIPGQAEWLERGGGCNACHLNYDKIALIEFKNKHNKNEANWLVHPSIDLNITNDHCMSCHSRSGRISTSYEGWHETTKKPSEIKNLKGYKVLPDQRVFEFIGSDIHHQRGMACIDCHGSYELMGDGKVYQHEEEAVSVQCSDCHRKKGDYSALLRNTDRETQMIRGFYTDKFKEKPLLLTEKRLIPLVNTSVMEDGRLIMTSKLTQKASLMKPPAAACTSGKVHQRLSCESCHTAWVPQCIGCHNSFDKQAKSWDMETHKETTGSWIEYAGKYFADKPVLGIRGNQVYTMAPGMVLSIDKGSFTGNPEHLFSRLYAPSSGHTTQKEGRSCKSCHNDPLAIGYGRGGLTYVIMGETGIWKFEPRFELNKYDGLPEDAWIPFLKERKEVTSTRTNVRPFNLEEQKRILEVGACLTCHEDQSDVMKKCLVNYNLQKKLVSNQCVLPAW